MPGLYQSKQGDGAPLGFDPIALQGHYVAIHYTTELLFRQVMFWEPIPRFQAIDIVAALTLGTLGVGATAPKTNLTNLDMFDDEFGQFRMWTLDNVQIRVFLPAGTLLHQLKNIQIPIGAANPLSNPSLNFTEMCVWEDNRPAVECVNGSAVALNAVRIMVEGYRYYTKPVEGDIAAKIKASIEGTGPSFPVTHVWCSGRS